MSGCWRGDVHCSTCFIIFHIFLMTCMKANNRSVPMELCPHCYISSALHIFRCYLYKQHILLFNCSTKKTHSYPALLQISTVKELTILVVTFTTPSLSVVLVHDSVNLWPQHPSCDCIPETFLHVLHDVGGYRAVGGRVCGGRFFPVKASLNVWGKMMGQWMEFLEGS